jgi:hypothetical protein
MSRPTTPLPIWARMTAPRSLTLEEWIESVRTEGRALRCPGCGAKGEWDRWGEGELREELLELSFVCGSQVQVIGVSGDDSDLVFTVPPQSPFHRAVYESLMKRCPIFGAPRPRRRLWRYAQ